MPFRKIILASAFLLAAAAPLQSQWGTGSKNMRIRDPSQICPGIVLEVKDSMGRAIRGAIIEEDDRGMRYATDIQGIVSIPCSNSTRMMRVAEVRASGFKPSKVSLIPNTRSRIDVILAEQNPMPQNSMFAVDVQELRSPARKQAQHLQAQAEEALQRNEFRAAEKLYLQAIKVNSKDASIANNLGVLALRRDDLDAANTWFEMAIQIDPYKAEYELNLGILRWMQNRGEESYSLLLQAADRGYEPDPSHYIQGIAGLNKGLYKEAAKHLKKVSRDRFPYRDLFLSLALRRLGKIDSADELFQDFLKRNPFPFAYVPPRTGEPNGTVPSLLAFR